MLKFVLLLFLVLSGGCRGLAGPGEGPPRASVTVVEATVSAPNEAERRASTRAADLIARHLASAGITVRRVTDDDVLRDGLQDRVAILAYNPVLPREERDRLSAHLQKGGRLIVFYSSDAALAGLLGFKLGSPQSSSAGQWASFAFVRGAPPLLDGRLVQTSRFVRPVYPDSLSARLIGWWENAAGKIQEMPAWALSGKGAWMSHILQEGDAAPRIRLLVGLAGHFDPAVLQAAAHRAMARGGAAPPYATSAAMIAALRESAGPSGRRNIASLEAEKARLPVLYRKGRYAELIEAEERLAARLAAACASTVPAVAGEFHAVWNGSGLGLYPGSGGWDRTARFLSDHGIHAVFPHVASAGVAHYPSRWLPQSEAGRAVGDPLDACCKAAQRRGLAVHAWKICWNLEGAPADLVERHRAAGRLQVDSAGKTLNWLCPSRADNVDRELAILEEIVRNYPVDGVQLDYIRYPDKTACYCQSCRAGFEKAGGLKVVRWPGDVLKAPLAERYSVWRAGQITRFVRLAQQRVRETRRGVTLSAAVYGWYPGCVTTLGQDWGEWVKKSYVAFVCPMNYSEDTAQFAGWLRKQMSLTSASGRIIPGIGATSSTSRLNGLQVLDQIRAARREGATGFILYDLNRALERDVLPLLSQGATRP
ncbi:MAG: family 10 glycosylhydrolase [Kiritimatiellia bacterium]